jgi:putative spermidine/putrescine transport system permease protein
VNRRLTGPGAWILYVVTAALMVFILAPLVVVIAMSVSDSYFVSFPPQGFTLKWYAQILQDRDFLAALKLSGLLALSTTIGSLLLGVPAAIALTRAGFPGQTFLKGLVLSPLIFPALVTGLALMQLLSAMGSGDARINLLIGHIVVTSPYVIRAVVTSLLLVDYNLEDAARTLGANR